MEIWKDINGYNGVYRVSNYGNVISYARKQPKILTGHITPNGYKSVLINYKGCKRQISVHRLVAQHFVDNFDSLNCVNHIDCNKLNNNVNNLEWCTHQYNNEHAKDNGLLKKGTEVNTCKLTEKDVLEIYNSSDKQSILMEKYNVSRTAIQSIKYGKSWRWLTHHE